MHAATSHLCALGLHPNMFVAQISEHSIFRNEIYKDAYLRNFLARAHLLLAFLFAIPRPRLSFADTSGQRTGRAYHPGAYTTEFVVGAIGQPCGDHVSPSQ